MNECDFAVNVKSIGKMQEKEKDGARNNLGLGEGEVVVGGRLRSLTYKQTREKTTASV